MKFSRAGPENPVLLTLDGHASHIRSVKIIDMAKENNVTIICFPPHCTSGCGFYESTKQMFWR